MREYLHANHRYAWPLVLFVVLPVTTRLVFQVIEVFFWRSLASRELLGIPRYLYVEWAIALIFIAVYLRLILRPPSPIFRPIAGIGLVLLIISTAWSETETLLRYDAEEFFRAFGSPNRETFLSALLWSILWASLTVMAVRASHRAVLPLMALVGVLGVLYVPLSATLISIYNYDPTEEILIVASIISFFVVCLGAWALVRMIETGRIPKKVLAILFIVPMILRSLAYIGTQDEGVYDFSFYTYETFFIQAAWQAIKLLFTILLVFMGVCVFRVVRGKQPDEG